jgi:hypothetical protein
MMEIVDANPQVRELMRAEYTVDPFKLDLNPTSDLKRFMSALNQELPFDQPSCLEDDEVVLRIAMMNEAYTGRIAKFVHQVTAFGIKVGVPYIDWETLVTFVRHEKNVKDEANIFLIARDAVNAYPAFMKQERKERVLASVKRRAKTAQQRRAKTEFGSLEP